MNKIKFHTCLIGKTGYNNHVRDFLSELNERIEVKIRNYTVSEKWQGLSDEPHNSEPYLNSKFKKMLVEQSLWVSKDKIQEFEIYTNYPNEGETPLDIVFMETNHHYFYEKFKGKSIAYKIGRAHV